MLCEAKSSTSTHRHREHGGSQEKADSVNKVVNKADIYQWTKHFSPVDRLYIVNHRNV